MTLELDEQERLVLAAWLGLKPLGYGGAIAQASGFHKAHKALCRMVDPMSLLERLAAATDKAEAKEPTVQDIYDKALAAYNREWYGGVRDEGWSARLQVLARAVSAAIAPGVTYRC